MTGIRQSLTRVLERIPPSGDIAIHLELNSGHLIFLEKPAELASAILSFCQ
jgi:pimeloyl-ACP methyl ester carboxylesterase